MFQIVLQNNKSEDNKMDKETTTLATLNGVLKENTSIINPIFIIESNLTSLVNCNYLSIPVFGRKYFIRDIISVNGKFVEISCHVDVLSSFANSLKQCTGIIQRQENKWNLYLNDGSFKVYQNPKVLCKSFPNGFTTQQLILAVAGG